MGRSSDSEQRLALWLSCVGSVAVCAAPLTSALKGVTCSSRWPPNVKFKIETYLSDVAHELRVRARTLLDARRRRSRLIIGLRVRTCAH